MKLCILHANCQGGPLERLLRASAGFAAEYELQHIVNYTHQSILAADLARCELFLYQQLGQEWGDLASAALLERLPVGATALCLPNPFFKGYWPLWTSASSMNFGDIYLDYLVDAGLGLPEITHLYLDKDLSAVYDLQALVAKSVERERERETGCILPLVDYVLDRWQQRQLFATVNHPGPELLGLIANRILRELDLPLLSLKQIAGLDLRCEENLELPIHPQVGKFFGLPFVNPERLYPVLGKQLNFRQYALCYIDCRKNGLNFLEYLAAVQI